MVETYSEAKTPNKKHYLKLAVFGFFALILIFLIYTSFSGDFHLTGSIINQGLDINNSIFISADLTIPTLSLDGEFEKLIIQGHSDSFLYAGDQKFSLSNSQNNYIILTNYDGEISFNDKNISELKGKVMKVSINGVPITSKFGSDMKVYFDTGFDYSFLEIKNKTFIKKLNYDTSGTIKLDEKTIVDLHNDNLLIERFFGDVRIEDNHFNIKGYLQRLDVQGSQQISISV